MPVSPDGGAKYAKVVADLYGDAVADLLRLVASRLARGIDGPGWADAKLTELLRLRADAQAVIAALNGRAPAAIVTALEASYTAALGEGVVATNQRAVTAYARELAGMLQATHTRILRTVDDVYRQVVADTTGQVLTGTATRRQAAARAMDRYANRGVTGYVDARGRTWPLESYAEMAARTASGQAHVQGGVDRLTSQGRDLVIVSDAPEECDLCRPYEGKVLSLSGVEPVHGLDGFTYAGSLDAARSAGFMHPNCRHSIGAFVPGLTTPMGATADPEGDVLRQRQRALERSVRESKRRVAAVGPFGDTPELARQKQLLRARQDRLAGFVAEHDRKRLRYRESLGVR